MSDSNASKSAEDKLRDELRKADKIEPSDGGLGKIRDRIKGRWSVNRIMVDAIHAYLPAAKRAFPYPDIIAGYGTGSFNIVWTAGDWSLWPGIEHVIIDQGFRGSPVPWANVRDVELGAWSPEHAVDRSDWTAERPTIYCSRSTLTDVIRAGWRGDVWLAYPGYTASTPPEYSGVNIVAVQHTTTRVCDISTVFDSTWPRAARKATEMIHMPVFRNDGAFIPFPRGSFHELHVYRDFLDSHVTANVRIALHSESSGYLVDTITLDTSSPKIIHFPRADVDAVSIENKSLLLDIGVTLA